MRSCLTSYNRGKCKRQATATSSMNTLSVGFAEQRASKRRFESPSKISADETLLAGQAKVHVQGGDGKNPKLTRLSVLASLTGCAREKKLHKGSWIHAQMEDSGFLEKDVSIGNTLVSMYAKCGELVRAQQVLDKLPVRNVVSWNALIAALVYQGRDQEALSCFHQMQCEGISPNAITYSCILKACGSMQDLQMGQKLHDETVRKGLLNMNNVALGNSLVYMYAKCGAVLKAQNVLNELHVQDVASWNALIAGYTQCGNCQKALHCFRQMCNKGIAPNPVTYSCALNACGMAKDMETGKSIYNEIINLGLFETDVVLGNALIDMYAKCGALITARQILDKLPVGNVVSWSALIAGYVQKELGQEALACFGHMLREGISPNSITYTSILKACGITKDVDFGDRIYNEVASQGLLKKNVVLVNCVVDMYAKCGALLRARRVLHELSVQDVASWNALLASYIQNGQVEEALSCLKHMSSEGMILDAITYVCILKVIGMTQDVKMGRKVHEEILHQGFLQTHVILGSALVDMYAKCGVLCKAQDVLDKLPARDVLCWSALIAGYTQQGQAQEALGCFECMCSEGLVPDAVTYACILQACGIMRDIEFAKQIHLEITSLALLKEDYVLGNALIGTYSMCGVLIDAQKASDELLVRDVVSWSALISGYAQQGYAQEVLFFFKQMQFEGISPDIVAWNALVGSFSEHGLVEEALECFRWMQECGAVPDPVTFIHVVKACSHSGLVDEGQFYFDSMKKSFEIIPKEDHFNCIADLFGRARLFKQAQNVVETMPLSNLLSVWSTLLLACQSWGNLQLAKFSFEHAIQLDRCDSGVYVLMSNIYATAGMLDAQKFNV